MLRPEWRRIAGLHVQDDGAMAAAWIAHDRDNDVTHLYDCCVFRREVLAVVAEGIAARGRWIPVAWHKEAKEIADKLLDRGVTMLPEHVEHSQSAIEAASLDIWERMRSHRFKVDKRLGEWREEYRTFYRQDSKVPVESHPLMAATRNAMMMLEYARAEATMKSAKKNFPAMSMV